jgi:hypothetical protein
MFNKKILLYTLKTRVSSPKGKLSETFFNDKASSPTPSPKGEGALFIIKYY